MHVKIRIATFDFDKENILKKLKKLDLTKFT